MDTMSQRPRSHLSSLMELIFDRFIGQATIFQTQLWHFPLVRNYHSRGAAIEYSFHLINGPVVEPWDLGSYQALTFAKTWSGKARLPSIAKMWEEYPGGGNEVREHSTSLLKS